MPRKKLKEAEASIEETLPIEEEAPTEEVEETPEAPKAEVKAPVTVGSLPIGAQFELARKRYRKLAVQAGKVTCLCLTNPELGWIGVTSKAFENSTLVIPK